MKSLIFAVDILIHNYAYTQDDDLAVSMPHIIKHLLGFDAVVIISQL